MEFEVDFNKENHPDEILTKLGAKLKEVILDGYGDYSYYYVEINSLDDLQELQRKVNEFMGVDPWAYSLIIDMLGDTNPTIFFDKDV